MGWLITRDADKMDVVNELRSRLLVATGLVESM